MYNFVTGQDGNAYLYDAKMSEHMVGMLRSY